jgi:hypothetical protein
VHTNQKRPIRVLGNRKRIVEILATWWVNSERVNSSSSRDWCNHLRTCESAPTSLSQRARLEAQSVLSKLVQIMGRCIPHIAHHLKNYAL